MKWEMYALGMVILFIMLIFGMVLISQGQAGVDPATKADPGYKAAEDSVNLVFLGLTGIPWVLGIIAAIAVFVLLMKLMR